LIKKQHIKSTATCSRNIQNYPKISDIAFITDTIRYIEKWDKSHSCVCRCVYRYAGGTTREDVRLLPGAVHRHNVQYSHPTSNSVLRLQPHHSVRSHINVDAAHLHSAARWRRKDRPRFELLPAHSSTHRFIDLSIDSDWYHTFTSCKLDSVLSVILL